MDNPTLFHNKHHEPWVLELNEFFQKNCNITPNFFIKQL